MCGVISQKCGVLYDITPHLYNALGYEAVTQNNGQQQVLAGGAVHLLTHRNWKCAVAERRCATAEERRSQHGFLLVSISFLFSSCSSG